MTIERVRSATKERIDGYNQFHMERYCRETGQLYRDFQTTLREHSLFAVPQSSQDLRIAQDVELAVKTIELASGFTVSYDLSWPTESQTLSPAIHSRSRRFYLKHLLHNPQTLAAINGGFFFLTDEAGSQPKDMSLNLAIHDGKVTSLSSSDRPALLTQNGKLIGKDLAAVGQMVIGNEEISWVGARSKWQQVLPEHAVLYNTGCSIIKHTPDLGAASGLRRVLQDDKNLTPKQNDSVDLVIDTDKNAQLVVSNIQRGGGTNLCDGLFILQMKQSQAAQRLLAKPVIPQTMDGVDLRSISAGITIGPGIHEIIEDNNPEINHDLSLGSYSPFEKGKRKARSVIYEKNGRMHMHVFDGVPFANEFKGVSIEEVSEIIGRNGYAWGYHLDPGHSARLEVKMGMKDIQGFGNKQRFRIPKDPSLPMLWNARNGTPISSAIVLNQK